MKLCVNSDISISIAAPIKHYLEHTIRYASFRNSSMLARLNEEVKVGAALRLFNNSLKIGVRSVMIHVIVVR